DGSLRGAPPIDSAPRSARDAPPRRARAVSPTATLHQRTGDSGRTSKYGDGFDRSNPLRDALVYRARRGPRALRPESRSATLRRLSPPAEDRANPSGERR